MDNYIYFKFKSKDKDILDVPFSNLIRKFIDVKLKRVSVFVNDIIYDDHLDLLRDIRNYIILRPRTLKDYIIVLDAKGLYKEYLENTPDFYDDFQQIFSKENLNRLNAIGYKKKLQENPFLISKPSEDFYKDWINHIQFDFNKKKY